MTKYEEGFIEKIACSNKIPSKSNMVKLADVARAYADKFYKNLSDMKRVYAESMANNNYASELRAKVRSGEIPVDAYRHWLRTSGYRYRPTNPMKNQIDAAKNIGARGTVGIMGNLMHNTMGGRSAEDIMDLIHNTDYGNKFTLPSNSKYTIGDLRNTYRFLLENDMIGAGGKFTNRGEKFITSAGLDSAMVRSLESAVTDHRSKGKYRKWYNPFSWGRQSYKEFALSDLAKVQELAAQKDKSISKIDPQKPTVAPLKLNPRLDLAGKKPTLDSRYASKEISDSISRKFS